MIDRPTILIPNLKYGYLEYNLDYNTIELLKCYSEMREILLGKGKFTYSKTFNRKSGEQSYEDFIKTIDLSQDVLVNFHIPLFLTKINGILVLVRASAEGKIFQANTDTPFEGYDPYLQNFSKIEFIPVVEGSSEHLIGDQQPPLTFQKDRYGNLIPLTSFYVEEVTTPNISTNNENPCLYLSDGELDPQKEAFRNSAWNFVKENEAVIAPMLH